jgi:hypothetical protein
MKKTELRRGCARRDAGLNAESSPRPGSGMDEEAEDILFTNRPAALSANAAESITDGEEEWQQGGQA